MRRPPVIGERPEGGIPPEVGRHRTSDGTRHAFRKAVDLGFASPAVEEQTSLRNILPHLTRAQIFRRTTLMPLYVEVVQRTMREQVYVGQDARTQLHWHVINHRWCVTLMRRLEVKRIGATLVAELSHDCAACHRFCALVGAMFWCFPSLLMTMKAMRRVPI